MAMAMTMTIPTITATVPILKRSIITIVAITTTTTKPIQELFVSCSYLYLLGLDIVPPVKVLFEFGHDFSLRAEVIVTKLEFDIIYFITISETQQTVLVPLLIVESECYVIKGRVTTILVAKRAIIVNEQKIKKLSLVNFEFSETVIMYCFVVALVTLGREIVVMELKSRMVVSKVGCWEDIQTRYLFIRNYFFQFSPFVIIGSNCESQKKFEH